MFYIVAERAVALVSLLEIKHACRGCLSIDSFYIEMLTKVIMIHRN